MKFNVTTGSSRPEKTSGGGSLSEETKLIDACCRQDRAAQRELYEKYSEQVYALMCRMVGRQNADDLTQQVFLRLLKSVNQFAGRSKFSTWLYRVASNEALQFLRKRAKRSDAPLSFEPTDPKPCTLRQVDDREQLEMALAELDPDLRAVFLLRESEGLSYRELASALCIAEGTVASRLNRARKSLQELMNGD